MPLPLVPIAAYAVTYGTVALAGYKLARSIEPGRRDQGAEDALDRVDEGVTLRREVEQGNVTGRLTRTLRFGRDGEGFEVDAAFLGRLRVRRTQP